MKSSFSLFVVLASVASLTACVYEDAPPRRLTPEEGAYTPAPAPAPTTGGTAAPPAAPSGTASPSTMLVEVDTDQTMNAAPGEGVGVFTEYGKGGHWHVWWTCDTNQTNQSCDYSVSVTAASGAITNLDSSELAGGFVTSPTTSRVDATSTTTNQVHGIYFDTAPGATITLQASMSGLSDPGFLFFVQDGKVNGGYAGTLTNPLQLKGNAP